SRIAIHVTSGGNVRRSSTRGRWLGVGGSAVSALPGRALFASSGERGVSGGSPSRRAQLVESTAAANSCARRDITRSYRDPRRESRGAPSQRERTPQPREALRLID